MRIGTALASGHMLADAEVAVRAGLASRRASFELSVERLPRHVAFAVAAGTPGLLEALQAPFFSEAEVDELVKRGLASAELGAALRKLDRRVDVDFVPEGTAVFAGAPLGTIESGLLAGLVVGALARAHVERATALATHVARLHEAAAGAMLVEDVAIRASSGSSAVLEAAAAFVGGAGATTHAGASAQLHVPLRAEQRLPLVAPRARAAEARERDDASSWGALEAEQLVRLSGPGETDELVALVELVRRGHRPGTVLFEARGACAIPLRFDLVALEEDGAWTRLPSRADKRRTGRERVTRYHDETGRFVCDLVHLQNERIETPHALGAASLHPLAAPLLRAGRALGAPESLVAARERSLASRRALPESARWLRDPVAPRVERSAAIRASS